MRKQWLVLEVTQLDEGNGNIPRRGPVLGERDDGLRVALQAAAARVRAPQPARGREDE